MQIPRQKNNVFGIRHHSKKHSNGNHKNKQHTDLAGPQKHKKFAETVKIHKILPKHDTKICRMDITNDKSFAKNKKFEWGPDQTLGLAKLKKHFATNRPLAMHDPKKQTKLQTDTSDKIIKAMVFQQRIFLDYYSRKLTLVETNYTTGNKKNVRGGGSIETLATLDTKNKTQNVRSYGPQKINAFFRNQTVKSKTSPVVKKTRML